MFDGSNDSSVAECILDSVLQVWSGCGRVGVVLGWFIALIIVPFSSVLLIPGKNWLKIYL